MITKIKKRDGREVPFNIEKISNAIFKAAQAAGGQDYNISMNLAEKVTYLIEEKFRGVVPEVEDIQDAVEKVLIESGHAKTAKEYILYRAERNRAREMDTRLMKVYSDLTFKSAEEVDIKRENANIDGDTAMGTMLKYGSEGAKQFYDLFILNPDHSLAHKSGEIHIHDLDFLTLTNTCCQIDIVIDDLDLNDNIDNIFIILEKDYNLIPTMEDNKDYLSLEGDYLLEVLSDKKVVKKIQKFAEKNAYKDTDKKTFQSMEAFVHNLNTMHSRAGAQIPFSSINYGQLIEKSKWNEDINSLLMATDILIDGCFQADKKDLTLPFIGSINQRIIDIKKSLLNKEIVLERSFVHV